MLVAIPCIPQVLFPGCQNGYFVGAKKREVRREEHYSRCSHMTHHQSAVIAGFRVLRIRTSAARLRGRGADWVMG